MTIGTVRNPVKVVLDTNIIISALGFGGKPREILLLAIDTQILALSSTILLAELEDVINKKFPQLRQDFEHINKLIRRKLKIVKPKKVIKILKDDDDNRVLEAASQGRVDYIITGDRDLLELKKYENIKIVNADEFLATHKTR